MMIVRTYDIDTTDSEGKRRIHAIARECEAAGNRVQDSVYEILLDPKQLDELKARLKRIMDDRRDTIRIYRLGDNYRSRIDVMGKTAFDPYVDLLEI